MPVSVSLDPKQPKSKEGKPYRHHPDHEKDCSVLKQTPSSMRKRGVPNTEKLRDRTERCPECATYFEPPPKPARGTKTGGAAAKTKAATQAAKPTSNVKSGALAAKAARARQRTKDADKQPAASEA